MSCKEERQGRYVVAHPISLKGWAMGNDAEEVVRAFTEKYVNEVVFSNDGLALHAYFPIVWKHPPGNHRKNTDGMYGREPTNPLHVYLAAEDRGDETSRLPIFEFDLDEALEMYLEECRDEGSFKTGLRELSAALRQLSEKIDAVVCQAPDEDLDEER